jgi:hypothetical protein
MIGEDLLKLLYLGDEMVVIEHVVKFQNHNINCSLHALQIFAKLKHCII